MIILKAFVLACSLCADCFAVSLCSGVTLKKIEWKAVLRIAAAFAVIQSGLLYCGWAFGNLFAGLIDKVAHIVGFILLLYVGGSMFLEGVRSARSGKYESRDLNGWRNIILGGTATSIDALAVGVSQSMAGVSGTDFLPLFIAVMAVTALSVAIGIYGGKTIGSRFGCRAEIVGGLVLICIGASLII